MRKNGVEGVIVVGVMDLRDLICCLGSVSVSLGFIVFAVFLLKCFIWSQFMISSLFLTLKILDLFDNACPTTITPALRFA